MVHTATGARSKQSQECEMTQAIFDLDEAELDFVSGGDLHNGGMPPWHVWTPGLEPWTLDGQP